MNQIPTTGTTALTSPDKIADLLNTFSLSQDVKPSSRSQYKRTLRLYFDWIGRKGYTLSALSLADLIAYKEDLLSSGMSSLTVGGYINSVRRFYEWAEANKLYPNIGKGVRAPKRVQEFKKQSLYPDQAKALLSFYQDRTLRDYAIITLLLKTALRTVEVIRANVEDITIKGGKRVLLIQGKGRDEKDQFVVLTDQTYKPIEDYLKTRGRIKTGEPLFTSSSNNSNGERLTTRTISYIAKEGLKAIGLDHRSYTAHSLRHTAVVNCRRAGGSLEQAQALARHKSPTTTQIYDWVFREEQRLTNSPEELLDSVY